MRELWKMLMSVMGLQTSTAVAVGEDVAKGLGIVLAGLLPKSNFSGAGRANVDVGGEEGSILGVAKTNGASSLVPVLDTAGGEKELVNAEAGATNTGCMAGVGPKGTADAAGLSKRLGIDLVLDPLAQLLKFLNPFPSDLSLFAMNEDHMPRHPPGPELSQSREATTGESSSQPRSGFRQTLRKFKKNLTKKVSKPFKRSRHQTTAVQNTDHQGVSSNQNIEDASRLHPSDGDKPANPENLSGRVSQEASGEPTSKVQAASSGVEEIPDPQSQVDAGLRDAHQRVENMRLLGGHVESAASTAKDGPKDLDAADSFQTTYLQPLRVFDTVIGDLANVHPYAKVVLGVLSTASKIILAQTERDESVQSLLKKLEQIYDFMSQKDTLGQISSKR
ncbi:hypothetical protein BDR03DRAFT_988096, partial [Suillus americanus]